MTGSAAQTARFVAVTAAYASTAYLGLRVAPAADAVTLLWAPAGIGLAAVLRWGPWMAGAAALGNLIGGGAPLAFGVWAATCAAIEALTGAVLMRRIADFRNGFDSLKDVVGFVGLAAGASAALAGALGATGLVVLAMIPPSSWMAVSLNWWLGDAMGMLVITPLVICWPGVSGLKDTAARTAEATLLALLVLLLSLVIFRDRFFELNAYPIAFLLLPAVGWAAVRFGPFGAAAATLLVSLLAIWGTLLGEGPFARESRDRSFRLMWGFIGITSVGALPLAVAVRSRERTESALRDSQRWLHLIESSAGAGTWRLDPTTGAMEVSEQQFELYGLEPTDAALDSRQMVDLFDPADRARLVDSVTEALRTRGALDLEVRAVWPDGSTRWQIVKGRCIPVDPQRPRGPFQLVGITLDVTERRQLEEAIRESERLASLGTFAAGVAHEINNPLGTILLAARTAQQAEGDAATLRTALDDIVEDAQRAGRIVKSVLQFARPATSEHADLDLNAQVTRAAAATRSYVERRQASLALVLCADPLPVSGNASALQQVFDNLIRNAAEACSPGGHIRIETRRRDSEIHASVSDDGCGLSDAHCQRVFEPFYTTRSRSGGSGLGLSICHGIVEAHGGSIELSSEPGAGTRVTITLPARGLPASGADGVETAEDRAGGHETGPRR